MTHESISNLAEDENKTANDQNTLQLPEATNNDLTEQQENEKLQHGVQLAQASTKLWGTRELILLYIL